MYQSKPSNKVDKVDPMLAACIRRYGSKLNHLIKKTMHLEMQKIMPRRNGGQQHMITGESTLQMNPYRFQQPRICEA